MTDLVEVRVQVSKRTGGVHDIVWRTESREKGRTDGSELLKHENPRF